MANPFTHVQMARPSASNFNLSHDVKYSMNMGVLTPILIQEVIPGDKFTINSQTLVRFAPMVAPVMHSINVWTHYFFVPNRLVWNNWEKFITANDGNSDIPAVPTLRFGAGYNIGAGSLPDYLGIPLSSGNNGEINPSAIPFAAYQMIYNEYFRDQNLINPVPYELTDGNQTTNFMPLQMLHRRAWQHDYFTSALPWAQKGGAVQIPLGTFNDVPLIRGTTGNDTFKMTDGSDIPTADGNIEFFRNPANLKSAFAQADGENMYYDVGGNWTAKTSDLEVGATTINDLRRAFRLQEWLEKMARGGSRYVEQLLVHFGVYSSDKRLNRPEFIGGTRSPVIISEVLQTSETIDTPQGTMAGHAISASGGNRQRYRAEEHGYIIGIQSIMPTTAYQQGLPRHFSRTSHLDYAWPTFAHIGEQEVLNKEIFLADDGENDEVFGYVPRYSEYRYSPSRVAGDFQTSLSFWHLGRIFENRPHLNKDFIECTPRQDIFAVTDESQKLWCHTYHKIQAYRKLPKYGTPTL